MTQVQADYDVTSSLLGMSRLQPRTRVWIVLALIVAFRVCFAVMSPISINGITARGGDEPFYTKIAQHIVEAHEYREKNLLAYRPPLYPAFVAVSLALGQSKFWLLQVLQNLLFLAAAVVFCVIARGRWGRSAGVYMALLLLINPVWLMLPQQVVSETLFICLLVLGVFCISRFVTTNRIRWCVFAGIAFGFSALTREIGLYFGIGAFACLLIKKEADIRHCLVAAASIFLAVLPWTFRNYEKLHAFVLVDTNGPINLYAGNNPSATGTTHWALPPGLQSIWNTPGTEMRIYKQARADALAYMESHPLQTLKLMPVKLRVLWGPIAITTRGFNKETVFRVIRFVFWIGFVVLVLLGLKTSCEHWTGLVVVTWALITTAIHLITFAQPSYRAPMEFFLALPAALGMCRVLNLWTKQADRVQSSAYHGQA